MENATKALLIAATILIAIVLIALGVLLVKNVNNSSEQAEKVSNSLSNATNNAMKDIIFEQIKSYEKSYNDIAEAKRAYIDVNKYIKEYNNSLGKEDAQIFFSANVFFAKTYTDMSFGDNLNEEYKSVFETLLQWSIEEGNEIVIHRVYSPGNNRIDIYYEFGIIKNHDDMEIYYYWD